MSELHKLAEEVGEIKEGQEQDEVAKEGEDFDVEDYRVDPEEYDGGW